MISNRGLEFLKRREDCSLEAYLDIGGIPTIGYGSLVLVNFEKVRPGDRITQTDADRLLINECRGIGNKIKSVTPLLRDCKLDALISFCYNIGTPAFKNSTLRKIINIWSEDPRIAIEFMKWNKAHVDGKLVAIRGLTNRRRLESNLYFCNDSMEAYEK